MAYAYDVQANVIHASKYKPTGKEHILLDTQILLWVFYSKISSPMLGSDSPSPYQLKVYPALFSLLMRAKSMLFHSGLNLPELFHRIERFECKLHCYLTKADLQPKQYRHAVSDAMQQIIGEVHTIWEKIGKISHLIPVSIDANFLQNSLTHYGLCRVDGYDRLMLEVARTAPMPLWILSDDGDMACVKGVTVITENQSVLGEAYSKKLVLP